MHSSGRGAKKESFEEVAAVGQPSGKVAPTGAVKVIVDVPPFGNPLASKRSQPWKSLSSRSCVSWKTGVYVVVAPARCDPTKRLPGVSVPVFEKVWLAAVTGAASAEVATVQSPEPPADGFSTLTRSTWT
jgi:hypothetical protein